MDEYVLKGETEENNGLYINGISYSYSISKSVKDNEVLIIKLYDSTKNSNINYTYEGNISKLKKDIKLLESFENLDEIITCLNDIFNKVNVQIEENHGEYSLKLKYVISGITKFSSIHLTKHDIKNEEKINTEDKINKLENKYKINMKS